METNNTMIISAEGVLDALVDGSEVLMVDKNKTNRFGVSCKPLSGETFSDIEKFIAEDSPSRIYLQTERYIKEENENEE